MSWQHAPLYINEGEVRRQEAVCPFLVAWPPDLASRMSLADILFHRRMLKCDLGRHYAISLWSNPIYHFR